MRFRKQVNVFQYNPVSLNNKIISYAIKHLKRRSPMVCLQQPTENILNRDIFHSLMKSIYWCVHLLILVIFLKYIYIFLFETIGLWWYIHPKLVAGCIAGGLILELVLSKDMKLSFWPVYHKFEVTQQEIIQVLVRLDCSQDVIR